MKNENKSQSSFKIVVKQTNGPILIEVRGTRLVLGRGISEKIYVEEFI